MPTPNSLLGVLFLACSGLSLSACGESGAGTGIEGTYASVENDDLTIAFKPGGVVELAAAGMGSSAGSYTALGDKITVTVDNQTHTFIKDGECVEDQRSVFGRLCRGGKAGEPVNTAGISTIEAAQGTWTASNADGHFKLTFTSLNNLKFEMTPVGGAASSQTGTFVVEGSKIFVTLSAGIPMVLIYVNNSFESSAFGLPMKFVKQ